MPNVTPFFQAFGPLLFGRSARSQIEKVKRLDGLGELYELFGDLLPDRLLSMSEEGPNSRERIFTPKVTFWAFVSQALDVGSACREVVRKVEAWWRWMRKDRAGELGLTPSAYCQARARLDLQTLRLIHGHLAWSLERRVQSQQLWLERRVRACHALYVTRYRGRPRSRAPKNANLEPSYMALSSVHRVKSA